MDDHESNAEGMSTGLVSVNPPGVGARRVSLGGGRWAPREIVAGYRPPSDQPVEVQVLIWVAADGVPVVLQVLQQARRSATYIDGDAEGLIRIEKRLSTDWQRIRGDDLRIALDDVVEMALGAVTVPGRVAPPGTPSYDNEVFADADCSFVQDGVLRPVTLERSKTTRPGRAKPRQRTPEHYRKVAEIVRNRPPGTPKRRAVQEAFGAEEPPNPISVLTARNWIVGAVKGGFLDDDQDEKD